MVLQRSDAGDAIDISGGSKKRRRVTEPHNHSQWSELPAVLLELILTRLGVIEFLILACVCKSWRAVAIAMKQEFMSSQGPLIFLMSTKAKKCCYFYNIFDDRLYRTALPHLAGNECVGFTCGYLVLRDSKMSKAKSNIWLVNPFTRHELNFPRPPLPYSQVVLASFARANPEFILLAFSRLQHPPIQIYRSGNASWTVFEYLTDDDVITIADVAVFKGKIYVLTSDGELGTLNLSSSGPMVKLLHVKFVSHRDEYLHLVPTPEELYLVVDFQTFAFKTFKLDFAKMEWERVKPMGKTLFLGEMKCCALMSFLTPAGGWSLEHAKSVCCLGRTESLGDCRVHFLSRGRLGIDRRFRQRPAIQRIFTSSPVWYFPHLSGAVDSVYEN